MICAGRSRRAIIFSEDMNKNFDVLCIQHGNYSMYELSVLLKQTPNLKRRHVQKSFPGISFSIVKAILQVNIILLQNDIDLCKKSFKRKSGMQFGTAVPTTD